MTSLRLSQSEFQTDTVTLIGRSGKLRKIPREAEGGSDGGGSGRLGWKNRLKGE